MEVLVVCAFLLYCSWNATRNWRKVQQNETAQGIVAWAIKKYLR